MLFLPAQLIIQFEVCPYVALCCSLCKMCQFHIHESADSIYIISWSTNARSAVFRQRSYRAIGASVHAAKSNHQKLFFLLHASCQFLITKLNPNDEQGDNVLLAASWLSFTDIFCCPDILVWQIFSDDNKGFFDR